VNRCRILAITDPVRQRVVLSADRHAGALKAQAVTKAFEARYGPALARQCDWTCLRMLPPAFEGVPKHPEVGEG
jgi:hypothetical protein